MEPRCFWYVAGESRALRRGRAMAVQILDEWIVVFRDAQGRAVALPDRCLHRCGRLSRGKVAGGELTCSYHGWTYDGAGRVVRIPSEGGRDGTAGKGRKPATQPYQTCEQDGYVYVRLKPGPEEETPFSMERHGERGWQTLRLVHDFGNTVTNCVENFIDVPHTAYVHEGIFRKEAGEAIEATVTRRGGEVRVKYRNERGNLGSFGWFLNPRKETVHHTDRFRIPNITQVIYRIGEGKRVAYCITSQSVPVSGQVTRVYTDITYRFGIWSWLARPVARRQAKRVIHQDIAELNAQMEVIRKYGERFIDTPADRIHKLVSGLREALERGEDPHSLPDHESTITFWV